MFCDKCGKKVDDTNQQFCQYCGAKLELIPTTQPASSPMSQPPINPLPTSSTKQNLKSPTEISGRDSRLSIFIPGSSEIVPENQKKSRKRSKKRKKFKRRFTRKKRSLSIAEVFFDIIFGMGILGTIFLFLLSFLNYNLLEGTQEGTMVLIEAIFTSIGFIPLFIYYYIMGERQ
jgi:hypothetical protein